MRRPKWLTIDVLFLLCALPLCACILAVLTASSSGSSSKVTKAHLGCQNLAQVSEAYREHEGNGKREFPRDLSDLHRPPWGGPSLLRHGEEELVDPWGNRYQIEQRRFSDGTEFILVRTTAPDGVPISQFGIGKNAEPRK